MNKKTTTNIGLAPGSGRRVKTTVVPTGTLPNDIRPADTFRKNPPASWGKPAKKK